MGGGGSRIRSSLTPSRMPQDTVYGMRSLPPNLQDFCEGRLSTVGVAANKRIAANLFVPSVQALPLKEVEALAGQSQRDWKRLVTDRSAAEILDGMKGSNVPLPPSVCNTILEILPGSTEDIGDVDRADFETRLAASMVSA